MRRIAMTLAVTMLLLGCSRSASAPTTTTGSASPAAAAATPAAGASVIFPDGTAIHVELASDDPTREQGLMYRDVLPPDRGMIFIFPQNGTYPFWMKNTLIPLDMIWIDETKKVNFVASDVPPCKADPCPSFGSTTIQSRYVLETAAGVAKKHNITPGAVLRFTGMDNILVR